MDRDARGGSNRAEVNENFFKVWSAPMAYTLGLIYADGAIIDSRVSSRTCYLLISNNDVDLLNQVRKAMSSTHRLDFRPAIKRDFGHGKTYLCKPSYRLRIGNKLIYSDLLTFGLHPRKSLSIKVPNIPDSFFPHFLRGYFDGDGCVNIYSRKAGQAIQVVFTSGSLKFLEELNVLLCNILRVSLKHTPYQSGAYRLAYKASEAMSVLKFMYQELDSSPYLKRKYGKYQEYLRKY